MAATIYDELISRIYAATTEAQGWSKLGDSLCNALGADMALIAIADNRGDQFGSLVFSGPPAGTLEMYINEVFAHDKCISVVNSVGAGETKTSFQLIHDNELKSFLSYEQFYEPLGFGQFLVSMHDRDDNTLSYLNLARHEKDRPFSDFEINLVSSLNSHIRRASIIWRKLAEARHHEEAGFSALNQLRHGCALVNRRGEIVKYNKQLEILASQGAVQLTGRRLKLSDTRANNAFISYINRLSNYQLEINNIDDIIRYRSKCNSDVIVHCVPFQSNEYQLDYLNDQIIAIVFINKASQLKLPPPIELNRLWGLTDTECKVLQDLVYGWTVKEISERHSVSYDAVRFHIKNIFIKTEVNKQTDLISLVFNTFGQFHWPK